AQGGVRAGPHAPDIRGRGGGDRNRERDGLRPRGNPVHRRPRAGRAGLGAAGRRNGGGELLLRARPTGGARRGEHLGGRGRGRRLQLRLLRGREERLLGTFASRSAAVGRMGWEDEMGEIVGAALVAHVPTIMLPEEVRLEVNGGKEITP